MSGLKAGQKPRLAVWHDYWPASKDTLSSRRTGELPESPLPDVRLAICDKTLKQEGEGSRNLTYVAVHFTWSFDHEGDGWEWSQGPAGRCDHTGLRDPGRIVQWSAFMFGVCSVAFGRLKELRIPWRVVAYK